MANMTCPCGHWMSTVSCPNDVEHLLVTDHTLDALAGETDGKKYADTIADEGIEVWKCVECGRLAVFENAGPRPVWYIREAR